MEAWTITGSELKWLVSQLASGTRTVSTLSVAIDRGVRVKINDDDVWSGPLGNRITLPTPPKP